MALLHSEASVLADAVLHLGGVRGLGGDSLCIKRLYDMSGLCCYFNLSTTSGVKLGGKEKENLCKTSSGPLYVGEEALRVCQICKPTES